MKDVSIFCSTVWVALELQLNIYSLRRWASSRNRECRGHHHCSLGKWTFPLDQREKELMGEEDMEENWKAKKGRKQIVLSSCNYFFFVCLLLLSLELVEIVYSWYWKIKKDSDVLRKIISISFFFSLLIFSTSEFLPASASS